MYKFCNGWFHSILHLFQQGCRKYTSRGRFELQWLHAYLNPVIPSWTVPPTLPSRWVAQFHSGKLEHSHIQAHYRFPGWKGLWLFRLSLGKPQCTDMLTWFSICIACCLGGKLKEAQAPSLMLSSPPLAALGFVVEIFLFSFLFCFVLSLASAKESFFPILCRW